MRLPRRDIPGYPMHVVQRGANRTRVFVDDADRESYLRDLGRSAADHALRIHGYVLMDNHVHLLVGSDKEGAAGAAMRALGARFGRRYNARHARTGPLWEGRFRSFLVDTDGYLLRCLAYVERNPVRAGMVAEAGDFRWSSARHHLGWRSDPLVSEHATYLALGATGTARAAAWRRALAAPMPASLLDDLRRRGRDGRPFGGEDFADRVAGLTGLPAAPASRGRRPAAAMADAAAANVKPD